MRKLRYIIYVILPILLSVSGWVVFNKYIRPNHYQLLFPYSVFQFRNSSPTITRIGSNDRVQIFIPEGDASVGRNEYTENVYVSDYWIDQVPVTVKDYKKFLAENPLLEPRYVDEYHKYWVNRSYELLPVVFVSWGQAEDYCEYYGGHLPTEIQWEKAGRGPDGIILYWDDSTKAFNKANYDKFFGGKTFSGWLPDGKTIYGVMDMSGNVREWGMEWMLSYDQPVYRGNWTDLLAIKEGTLGRILKGGSYVDDVSHLRLNSRDIHDPNSPGLNRGFRCVYEK